MVKAQDLRVGNWVLNHNIAERVTIWHLQVLFYNQDNQFKPIHLSEEILIKAGWIWNSECDSFEKYPNGDSRLNISKPSSISGKRTIFNYVLKAKIADVTYLHELQNLYFALTGKELEIEL